MVERLNNKDDRNVDIDKRVLESAMIIVNQFEFADLIELNV